MSALAQSRHTELHRTCPLSGVKRTLLLALQMSANDPKTDMAERPRPKVPLTIMSDA